MTTGAWLVLVASIVAAIATAVLGWLVVRDIREIHRPPAPSNPALPQWKTCRLNGTPHWCFDPKEML